MSTIGEAKKSYTLRPFIDAPETKEPVETVALEAIDLSTYQDGPEGLPARQKLAAQLEHAVTTYGFFKLVGHGIPETEFDLLRSIAQSAFELPEEQKRGEYLAGTQVIEEDKERRVGVIRGTGYKPHTYWYIQDGVKDRVEFFNFRHFLHDDILYNQFKYPEVIRDHLPEIAHYFQYLHNEVLRKILTLFDLILEIPEGQLWANHWAVHKNDVEKSGGGGARFLLYHELDKEYINKTNGTWSRGHSDSTGLTFIYSQPILALQIRDYATGKWTYVSHTPNALIVNIGDSLKFLSGGYFKSALHRVVAPPADQQQYKRSVVILFSDPSNDTVLHSSSVKSPKVARLLKEGYPDVVEEHEKNEGLEPITFRQWFDEKIGYFNRKDNTDTTGNVALLGRSTLVSFIDPKNSEGAGAEKIEAQKVAA